MLAICWWRGTIRAGAVLAVVSIIVVAAAVMMAGAGGVNPAAAQSGGDGGDAAPPSAPMYDEAEAQDIDRMLMCPVCPAQTIDQTEVTLAQQMRAQVRELLADGASRAEVLAWFRERYGPGIVAEPPRSGINLIAWLVPGAVVVIAIAGGILVLRAMRRREPASASETPSETDDLQPWLDAVDRDLAQAAGPGNPPTITTTEDSSNG